MKKNIKKVNKNTQKEKRNLEEPEKTFYAAVVKVEPFRALTERQAELENSISSQIVSVAIGPAGTGKTHVAVAIASVLLGNNLIKKIIITRPVCETGRNLGAVPGEIDDKYKPFMQPMVSLLNKQLTASRVKTHVKYNEICILPLEYMRGDTFEDCVVILDEAQNTTPEQMKMFLTRIGKNCKIVITGDLNQSDLKQSNGLSTVVNRLSHIDGINVITFTLDDIVRHGIVRDILIAW
jgi:phosphate starvation-inducible PhoH-like protein